ncbi:MAG: hypothetical protein KC616_21590 [Myxococcales bacterium]|nr:hypothetical protein [Myxococcales bacterium]
MTSRSDMDPIRRLSAAVIASAFDDLDDAKLRLRRLRATSFPDKVRIGNAIEAALYLIHDRDWIGGPDLDLWGSVLEIEIKDIRNTYRARADGVLEAIVRELVRVRDRLPPVTRDRITAVEWDARRLEVAA